MPQKDAEEIKRKIISFIQERGPSLPIQIANSAGLSMLFASAFLSELLTEQKIKMTHMRVGSSPVYYIPGQEEGLEKYSTYLKSKEKEAYDLIRQGQFLIDEEQLPAIRVALRAIKDFAIPLETQEGVWRYFLTDKNGFAKNENKTPAIEEKQLDTSTDSNPEDKETKENDSLSSVKEFEEVQVNSGLTEIKTLGLDEVKDSSSLENFEVKLKEKLNALKIKILEETQVKKKEFYGLGRMETNLGELEVLIIAKDKKTVNDKDLEKIFEQVAEQKKLAIFLCTGEISKKTKETYRIYKNSILFQKID